MMIMSKGLTAEVVGDGAIQCSTSVVRSSVARHQKYAR